MSTKVTILALVSLAGTALAVAAVVLRGESPPAKAPEEGLVIRPLVEPETKPPPAPEPPVATVSEPEPEPTPPPPPPPPKPDRPRRRNPPPRAQPTDRCDFAAAVDANGKKAIGYRVLSFAPGTVLPGHVCPWTESSERITAAVPVFESELAKGPISYVPLRELPLR